MNIHEKIRLLGQLADTIEKQQLERFKRDYPNHPHPGLSCRVNVKPGKKYYKVDIGSSGKYMVDMEGQIFGIKAYGQIHKGHFYGTLDTINQWYWGDYVASKLKGGTK